MTMLFKSLPIFALLLTAGCFDSSDVKKEQLKQHANAPENLQSLEDLLITYISKTYETDEENIKFLKKDAFKGSEKNDIPIAEWAATPETKNQGKIFYKGEEIITVGPFNRPMLCKKIKFHVQGDHTLALVKGIPIQSNSDSFLMHDFCTEDGLIWGLSAMTTQRQ